jgi:lipopolysaccharide biosynthesis protein
MAMKAMKKLEDSIRRKYRGLKTRSRNSLAHLLLSTLEKIPPPWKFAARNLLFNQLPSLFFSCSFYQSWQEANRYFVTHRNPKIEIIDLAATPLPQKIIAKKIAIQTHIFYPELAGEIAYYLKDFPVPFDLLISTPDASNEEVIRNNFKDMSKLKTIHLLITPNRGRDFAPLLVGFGKQLLQYEYFAHLHTKKSIGANSIGNAWRQYLYQGLLDCSGGRIQKLLELLEDYGLIYPQRFPLIDVQNCQWGSNYPRGKMLFESIGIDAPADGFIEFPVGSMFWANTQALKPLLEHAFVLEDFEAELDQTDNTLMHTLERSLGYVALSQGFPVGILPYSSRPFYYP